MLNAIDELMNFLSRVVKYIGVFGDFWFAFLRNAAVLALIGFAADSSSEDLPALRYIYDFSLVILCIWVGAKAQDVVDRLPRPKRNRWVLAATVLAVIVVSVLFTVAAASIIATVVVGLIAARP
jgi:hypothetical protein